MVNRKKSSSYKKQKVYKMKGCSKTKKNYLGGNHENNISMTYPSKGPQPSGFNIFNSYNTQKGGTCGGMCGLTNPMMGGGKHRKDCKCSKCKKTQKGGSGNNGIPYPNGLTGSPWTPNNLPGQSLINGDSNYYSLNKYSPVDISRQMVDVGAQPPFLGVKFTGGKKRGTRKNKKNQKAGGFSNFLYQDLLNLGRQFQYDAGSSYNALKGYNSPVNPMPWKGQLSSNTSNLNRVFR